MHCLLTDYLFVEPEYVISFFLATGFATSKQIILFSIPLLGFGCEMCTIVTSDLPQFQVGAYGRSPRSF